jgi:alkylation response protein AidB-like acyl-CoA dehydrogenase
MEPLPTTSLSAAKQRYGPISRLSLYHLIYDQDGFTVILVERGPGVETRQIKTSYSTTAGTAYITFDNVKVPVENTLGEEGGGVFVILRFV